jgi:hypothetical protein
MKSGLGKVRQQQTGLSPRDSDDDTNPARIRSTCTLCRATVAIVGGEAHVRSWYCETICVAYPDILVSRVADVPLIILVDVFRCRANRCCIGSPL